MMKAQGRVVWPYFVLTLSLVGALAFGGYQTNQKNRLALESENRYMSAFHQLKFTSENVEERTARLMATNDPRLQQGLLADLRVFSARAVDYLAVLPLVHTETPRVYNFLNMVREQSDVMHEKLAQGESLSPGDWNQITEMRRQSVHFESELGNLLGLVGNGVIRWRDTVQATGPNQTGNTPTPVTRSVLALDQSLTPPPGQEQALAPQAGGTLPSPRTDPGPPVGTAEAIAAVRRFVDMPLQGTPTITGQSDPNNQLHEFSLYFMNAVKQNGVAMNFGVSIHGGHVIYMIDGRPVTDRRFTQPQLVERARDMLRRRGYQTADLMSAVENAGTLMMDFAPVEQGVFVETDRIKVSLAMDNAELVGFDARNYWVNRHARQFTAPALSAAQALQRVSPRVTVDQPPRLALIADRRRAERVAWEVRGNVGDQRYIIYVDATTGQELELLRLSGDPTPPFQT